VRLIGDERNIVETLGGRTSEVDRTRARSGGNVGERGGDARVRLVGRERGVRDNSGNEEDGRGPGISREHGGSFGSIARGVSRVDRHIGESLNLSLGSKGNEYGEARGP
jgi:hypothetical protein